MVEDETAVVRSGHSSQRSLLTDRNAVDLLRVSGDLAYAVTAVCRDAVSESLLAVTDRNDSLRVAIPCNVVDSPGDDVVVA